MGKIVCWFSGGVTSTVATKLALERYDDVEIIFFETGNHHPEMIGILPNVRNGSGNQS